MLVKRPLHWADHETSQPFCIGSELHCPLVRYCEEIGYEKGIWKLVWRYDGQLLSELFPLLIFLYRPSSHLYATKRFNYWEHDCKFNLCLGWHARVIHTWWKKVEWFAIFRPISRSICRDLYSWWLLEQSRLLCPPTPQIDFIILGIFYAILLVNIWVCALRCQSSLFYFSLHFLGLAAPVQERLSLAVVACWSSGKKYFCSFLGVCVEIFSSTIYSDYSMTAGKICFSASMPIADL